MRLLFEYSLTQVAFAGSVIFIAYALTIAVYRIFLSPISHIPGPKLAALTYWYECYHDVIHRGQFVFHMQTLHKRYGPIIRINPHEVHIIDPAFYNTLYSTPGQKRDRDYWHTRANNLDRSLLSTIGHDLHRKRRAALSPFFSTASVHKLEGVIRERTATLLHRLLEGKGTDEVFPMDRAFAAWSNDVINDFSFGSCDHRIEAPDFDPEFHELSLRVSRTTIAIKQFPWVLAIVSSLPRSLAMNCGPELAAFVLIRENMQAKIREVKMQVKEKEGRRTIFHELLNSNLPEEEKETSRMAEEGVLVIAAGTDTTAWTLAVATYYLLSSPIILRTLKRELADAQKQEPREDRTLPLNTLEHLPYLTAVIKEALRLSYGVSGRLTRVAPENELVYGEYVLPRGTSISMTTVHLHHNETNFPESKTFLPERWLGDAGRDRDRFLTSFSRGSRGCLGINLAWTELYIALGSLFGTFGAKVVRDGEQHVILEPGDLALVELFETDVGDVEIRADGFFPQTKQGSKGVRIRVLDIPQL
ncbi:hypothetical protein PVAG01_04267 [Phlyctema vagabunda]|uniref:Cytochrome P450 n=1 Tax=Phlyctema vagabunda TaxID=108571 RepID=A0ABR4PQ26_9HELO